MRLPTIAWALPLLAACASGPVSNGPRGALIRPVEGSAANGWTEEERAQPVAMRNLRRSPEASFHLLRITGERPAHIHERSDLVFMLLAGGVEMTLGDRTLTLKAGDVVEIPRATSYGLRNRAGNASVAYLVYTPPLAADDQKPASGGGPTESVWKWNLWVQ